MPRISRDAHETSLQVVSNLEVIKRIRPPKDLSGEQRAEFERVVATAPADWFAPLHIPILVRFCQHQLTAKRIDEVLEIALAEGSDPVKIDVLLKAQARETKAILQLATALRLTPRSTSPRGVSIKRLSTIPSPWHGTGTKEALPRRLSEEGDAD